MGYSEDTCKVFTDGVGKCELQEFEGVCFWGFYICILDMTILILSQMVGLEAQVNRLS